MHLTVAGLLPAFSVAAAALYVRATSSFTPIRVPCQSSILELHPIYLLHRNFACLVPCNCLEDIVPPDSCTRLRLLTFTRIFSTSSCQRSPPLTIRHSSTPSEVSGGPVTSPPRDRFRSFSSKSDRIENGLDDIVSPARPASTGLDQIQDLHEVAIPRIDIFPVVCVWLKHRCLDTAG